MGRDGCALCFSKPAVPGSIPGGRASPPAAPLPLVVPPLGRVRVLVPEGLRRLVRSLELSAPVDPEPRVPVEAEIVQGVAEFALVGVGCQCEVTAPGNNIAMRFDGPRHQGEVVTVTLQRPSDWVRVVGRLLDRTGLPVREAKISIAGVNRSETPWLSSTDENGSFEADLGIEQHLRWVTSLGIRPSDDRTGGLARTGPISLRAGQHDLGDLRLEDLPVLAAGVILGTKRTAGDLRSALVVECGWAYPDGRPGWSDLASRDLLLFEVDEDCSFRVHGDTKQQQLRISLRGELLRNGPVEFTPPASNLRLEVLRCRLLRASARLPRDLPDEMLGVLRSPQGKAAVGLAEHVQHRLQVRPERSGDRLVWEWFVPEGSYDVSLHVVGFPKPVVAVPAVSVGDGVADPRLVDIDLEPLVAGLRLDVFDEAGQPVEVRLHAADCDRLGTHGVQLAEPGTLLLAPRGPQDLFLYEHDFEPVVLRAVAGSARAVLPRFVETEQRWPAATSLPEGITASVGLHVPANFVFDWSLPATWYRRDACERHFDAGVARLRFGEGPVALELSFYCRKAERSVTITDVQPNPVHHSKTPIELRVAPEVLADALAKLR